jgi:hypothetical protein
MNLFHFVFITLKYPKLNPIMTILKTFDLRLHVLPTQVYVYLCWYCYVRSSCVAVCASVGTW